MNETLTTILAKCLEVMERGETDIETLLSRYPDHSEELAGLLGLAAVLPTVSNLPADPGYRFRTRKRLLEQFSNQRSVTLWDRFRHIGKNAFITTKRRPAMSFLILMTLMLSLLTGGTAYASELALPGDLLYPVKLFVEEVYLVVTGEEKNVELHMRFAGKRLDEVDSLVEKGRFEDIDLALMRFSSHVQGAVDGLSNDHSMNVYQPGDVTPPYDLHLGTHITVLEGLLDTVPDEAKPAITRALDVSTRGLEKLKERFPDGLPRGPGEPPDVPDPIPPVPLPVEPPGKPDDVPPISPGSEGDLVETPTASQPPLSTEASLSEEEPTEELLPEGQPTPPVSPSGGRP